MSGRAGGAGKALVASVITVLIGALVAAAGSHGGSHGGSQLGPLPAFAACVAVAFAMQWLAFIPAFIAQTEAFYDLTGSITYVTVVLLALSVGGDARSLLLAALIGIWALRLGSFLFLRIRRDGGDSRFTAIKPQFFRFLFFWTLQGLWVSMTAAAALAAMTSGHDIPLGAHAAVGAALWVAGFALEVVADHQKRAFRRDPANAGRFIQSGLWAWSRHPNYAGEILLWVGIAVISAPALESWALLTLVSPLFVYVLLTRISGVPPLEAQARKRWGEEPVYIAYRDRTPVLWPRPPRQP